MIDCFLPKVGELTEQGFPPCANGLHRKAKCVVTYQKDSLPPESFSIAASEKDQSTMNCYFDLCLKHPLHMLSVTFQPPRSRSRMYLC
jgi:hypothetical protein